MHVPVSAGRLEPCASSAARTAASSRAVLRLPSSALLLDLHLVRDPQRLQRPDDGRGRGVDPDDLLLALLQLGLVRERRLGDLGGEPAVLDAAQDAGGHRPLDRCRPGRGSGRRSSPPPPRCWSVSASTYQEPPSGSATLRDAGLLQRAPAACAARSRPPSRSAARAPRRARWCAASWSRRAPRPAPRPRSGRRCCPAAARSARRRRSGCGSAARAPARRSRRRRRAASAPRSGGRRGTSRSPRRSRCAASKKNDRPGANALTSRPRL